MLESGQLFERFKRSALQPKEAPKQHKDIFLQIKWDDYGAFLEIVNDQGKAIETSYLNYSGAMRNILRTLEQIRERNNFVINWDRPNQLIYLAEHDYLLEMLKPCKAVVDAAFKPLSFSKTEEATLRLQVQPSQKEGHLTAQIVLLADGQQLQDFRFITEQYVLVNQQIIEVAPQGSQFAVAHFFNAEIQQQDLVLYLSLALSNLDHLELHYKDYQFIKNSEEKVQASPCLIFEKLDNNNNLFLRVGQSLPQIHFDALESYDVFRYADVNDFAQTLSVRYIEQTPQAELTEQIVKLLRKNEPKKNKSEREAIVQDGSLLVVPADIAQPFIYTELPKLLGEFAIFGAEKLREYKIKTVPPKLDFSLSHNIDFLEGEVNLDFEGEKISLFEVLQQYNKQRYVQLSDGSHALLNEEYIRRLERLFKKKNKKAQISFFDIPLLEDLIEEAAKDKVFARSRKFFEGFNALKNQKKAKTKIVNATLRPYQQQGINWLEYLHEQKMGACLADDMGLGKTLQTLALLSNIYPKEKAPSLIVMPRSLIFNWEAEVQRFAPQLQTYTFYGQSRDYEAMRSAHLIFTTYATMRNEIEKLKEESFYYIILDESQNIKNINAQTTKAALLLKGKHRLALSGTPIENNLGELFALFHFLNPAMFGTWAQFSADYLVPIQKYNEPIASQELRKKIYPFILRRLKKEVLTELPDKIEQTLYVDMNEDQKKLYEQRRQYYAGAIQAQIQEKGVQGAQFFIFQALNELRQIATVPESISEGRVESSKLELLGEQLLDAVANGHKVLVFVNFLAAIESIGAHLDAAGIGYASMTGATRNREAQVQLFQNDPDCRVFLMTLKTGGTGLNLTAASTIFIYDPWWNVAAENQAIDRAYRMGQKQKVLAYKLIVKNSIEEKILQLQEVKRALFDNIISADGASLKSFSEEDIKLLLAK